MSKRHIPSEFLPENSGHNNLHFEESRNRLIKGQTFKELSTVWITPTRPNAAINSRVVSSWIALMRPMNQAFLGPLFVEGDEVGVAYSKAFEMILAHPELSKWKYILTVEDDNLPPSDGLLKLYKSIEEGYDAVGGLYWTKSTASSDVFSQPMIYGDPAVMPLNFIPQVPVADTLQPCRGGGMGFNLWKISSLKRKLKDMPQPWFRTLEEVGRAYTQDLYFFQESAKHGFKYAVDTRVRVGHLDKSTNIVW